MDDQSPSLDMNIFRGSICVCYRFSLATDASPAWQILRWQSVFPRLLIHARTLPHRHSHYGSRDVFYNCPRCWNACSSDCTICECKMTFVKRTFTEVRNKSQTLDPKSSKIFRQPKPNVSGLIPNDVKVSLQLMQRNSCCWRLTSS